MIHITVSPPEAWYDHGEPAKGTCHETWLKFLADSHSLAHLKIF